MVGVPERPVPIFDAEIRILGAGVCDDNVNIVVLFVAFVRDADFKRPKTLRCRAEQHSHG